MKKSVSLGLQMINCSDICASNISSDILVVRNIFITGFCSFHTIVARITTNAGQRKGNERRKVFTQEKYCEEE